MATTLPTYDEICMLPAAVKAEVVDDFIDDNGHMNIKHYFDMGARGAARVLDGVGIDDTYRGERRIGFFTVEHHLRYYAELRLGEEMSAHPRLLARSDKAFHMVNLLANDTQRRLANTMEIVFVHVDLDTRRPTAMPDDVAAMLDNTLNEHRALDWDVPLCGSMSVRG